MKSGFTAVAFLLFSAVFSSFAFAQAAAIAMVVSPSSIMTIAPNLPPGTQLLQGQFSLVEVSVRTAQGRPAPGTYVTFTIEPPYAPPVSPGTSGGPFFTLQDSSGVCRVDSQGQGGISGNYLTGAEGRLRFCVFSKAAPANGIAVVTAALAGNPAVRDTKTITIQQSSTPTPLPTPTPASGLSVGLVGHWKFDEGSGTTAGDSSGRGHGGTLVGGAAWASGPSCIAGSCIQLNGQNGFVRVRTTQVLRPRVITVAAWAKSSSPTWNTYGWIVSSDSDSNSNGFIIHPDAGTKSVRFFVTVGGGWKYVTSEVDDITKWHHYAMTFDGRSLKAFVDGAEAASLQVSGDISYGASPNEVRIGSENCCGGRYGNGFVDDVNIWDRALSASEVKQLYDEKKPELSCADYDFNCDGKTLQSDQSVLESYLGQQITADLVTRLGGQCRFLGSYVGILWRNGKTVISPDDALDTLKKIRSCSIFYCSTNSSEPQKIGDITGRSLEDGRRTGDGVFDSFDTIAAGNLAVGSAETNSICCADVNADGVINSADGIKISRIADGIEQSPGVCPVVPQGTCEINDEPNPSKTGEGVKVNVTYRGSQPLPDTIVVSCAGTADGVSQVRARCNSPRGYCVGECTFVAAGGWLVNTTVNDAICRTTQTVREAPSCSILTRPNPSDVGQRVDVNVTFRGVEALPDTISVWAGFSDCQLARARCNQETKICSTTCTFVAAGNIPVNASLPDQNVRCDAIQQVRSGVSQSCSILTSPNPSQVDQDVRVVVSYDGIIFSPGREQVSINCGQAGFAPTIRCNTDSRTCTGTCAYTTPGTKQVKAIFAEPIGELCRTDHLVELTCVDSDGGLNYEASGSVTLRSGPKVYADTCLDDGRTLVEFACGAGQSQGGLTCSVSDLKIDLHACAGSCSGGVCVGGTQRAAGSSAGAPGSAEGGLIAAVGRIVTAVVNTLTGGAA